MKKKSQRLYKTMIKILNKIKMIQKFQMNKKIINNNNYIFNQNLKIKEVGIMVFKKIKFNNIQEK